MDMEFSTILAVSLILLITFYIILTWGRNHSKYKLLPPGPTPLPLLGTPKYMNMQAATRHYNQLSQKYGSVFTVWKLTEPVVVLCGYETVKEALLNHAEEFSDRPVIPSLHVPTKGYSFNGHRWRALRRFTLISLRNYGMGKKTMESRVLEEATYLTQAVADTEGKPFNPSVFLGCAIANILSSVLFGEHFDYKNHKLHELIGYNARHIQGMLSKFNMVCNVFPFLLKLSFMQRISFKDRSYLEKFLMKYIEEHKRTLNPEAPRDLIDQCLMKMKEVEHEVDPDFCDLSLLMILVSLLSAGLESTSSTLKFSLFLIANFPDVQAKIQQEIDAVTLSLRPPSLDDKPQLPYTNAVIHEIQRVQDLAPTALFHAMTKDLQFRGYTIPKGTIIIPFLSSVLNDPSQWETPEEFNPAHFLDKDGQFRNRVAFMPFSTGKRVCVGENLARMELFLLFSALLQKFSFRLVPGTERQDIKALQKNKQQIMNHAEVCAVPRVPTNK
ncbi:cytochrome P450 2B19-like isoform X2 [Hyperolius riggenbachi]|uniref:cytochrome P450 2B19-like isoform X2 n=1 Tax=Hyperolius riggenbachi TaxID=752182 RepID=UPI0035A2EFAE